MNSPENFGGLIPGDSITVTHDNGSTAVFEVYKSEIYLKAEFPTKALYSPTPGAEIGLITCDGFTPSSGQFVQKPGRLR
ncbi:sortase domain-containing protein [Arthrobacter castelli]|uniref:sortase domain-containing protein n=1 Tax=Arthrobacter castelli TaxID=271431 RepID=UPI0004032B6F|nr:class F sortase [Arthrobacter castelli]